MTIPDKDPYKKEEEIVVDAAAVSDPSGGGRPNEPPIPAGHSRFYCEKCHTVSPCNNLCTVLGTVYHLVLQYYVIYSYLAYCHHQYAIDTVYHAREHFLSQNLDVLYHGSHFLSA